MCQALCWWIGIQRASRKWGIHLFVCLFVGSFIICSFDSYLLSAYYVPGTVLDTEASSDQRKSPCMQLVKKTHENKSEEIPPKKLVRMRTDKRPFDPTSMRDHREQFWWTDGYKTWLQMAQCSSPGWGQRKACHTVGLTKCWTKKPVSGSLPRNSLNRLP